MADMPDGRSLLWRKSSRSSDTANCVQFATTTDRVGVRDSKNPDGPILWFGRDCWRDFIAAVNDGKLDVPASPQSEQGPAADSALVTDRTSDARLLPERRSDP
jgi:hypothetical protein